MRLNRLTLRGITRFADTVSVNFAQLPAGLVAFVGANGEGKTTLMESIPGALFRQLPSRDGALPNHVQGRDAFIELEYDLAGNHYRSLIKADGQTGSQEAHLFNGTVNTPLVSGKVKEYDAAIAERIGTPELFLASVFQSQTRKGNFLELGKGDRKALMIRMLGLEQLQVISDKAGERAKAIEQDVAIARAKLQDLDAQLTALDNLRNSLTQDEAKLQEAQAGVTAARAKLQELVEEEARIKAQLSRGAELSRDIAQLRQELSQLAAKRTELMTKLTNNQALLERAAQVRAAVDLIKTFENDLATKRQAIALAERDRELILEDQQKAQALTLQASELERRVDDLARQAGDAKTAKLGKLDSEIRLAEQALAKERQVAASLKAKAENHAREGTSLRERSRVLEEIPCGDSFPTCSLIAQAIAARDGIAMADDAAREAQQEAAAATERCADLEGKVTNLETERAAVMAAPVEEPAEVAELRAQVAQLRQQAQGPEASSALIAVKNALARLQGDVAAIESRITETRKTADLIPRLEAAESRIAELNAELAQLAQEHAAKTARESALVQELAQTPTEAALQVATSTRQATENSIKAMEDAVSSAQGLVASRKARIADLEAKVPDRDALADRLEELFTNLADWKHLHRAFGKDGIQALEIDAAGPEVSALINDLLLSCFGPRFTLSFETTALKADGKGEKEVFDIRIIDNERGREGKLETLSGGEKVILNEAISLALAIYNARKSGQRFETLFRDETAGALDPQNAERYLQMLRRALELGGFHQLVFIAHQQELWEQADARVFVRGGRADVA